MSRNKQSTNKPSPKNRPRTYARNRLYSRTGRELETEPDGLYLIKLMLVILLGSFWLKFGSPAEIGGFQLNGVPIGLIVGLFLVNKYEQFQSNRKIWYALLVLVAMISYFLPSGIVI